MSDSDSKVPLQDLNAADAPPMVDDADRDDGVVSRAASDLEAVFDVPVQVSAVLGRSRMDVGELLKLGPGTVLELDRRVGEQCVIGAIGLLDTAAPGHGHCTIPVARRDGMGPGGRALAERGQDRALGDPAGPEDAPADGIGFVGRAHDSPASFVGKKGSGGAPADRRDGFAPMAATAASRPRSDGGIRMSYLRSFRAGLARPGPASGVDGCVCRSTLQRHRLEGDGGADGYASAVE